jgi:hypothetical protein
VARNDAAGVLRNPTAAITQLERTLLHSHRPRSDKGMGGDSHRPGPSHVQDSGGMARG